MTDNTRNQNLEAQIDRNSIVFMRGEKIVKKYYFNNSFIETLIPSKTFVIIGRTANLPVFKITFKNCKVIARKTLRDQNYIVKLLTFSTMYGYNFPKLLEFPLIDVNKFKKLNFVFFNDNKDIKNFVKNFKNDEIHRNIVLKLNNLSYGDIEKLSLNKPHFWKHLGCCSK